MTADVFDPRPCALGEGAFWHPEREQFFWFDIPAGRLLSQDDSGPLEWDLGRIASAAGWIDRDRLMVATQTGLAVLDLDGGRMQDLVAIEADRADTRSNDGRADRQGGFWFGTMSMAVETGAGAIYRYHRGQVRMLYQDITIPNAICFSVDGRTAYLADTALGVVWRQPLDDEGWPSGGRQNWLDLGTGDLWPDGAVIDAEGGFCCAFWGQGAVIRFDADGRQTHRFDIAGRHASCPAFGGPGLDRMLVTSAQQGIDDPDTAQGATYILTPGLIGLPEPRVIL